MTRTNIALVFIIAAVLLTGFTQKDGSKETKKTPPAKSALVSYKKDIVPIFKKYCLPCHSEAQMNPSELYMETYDEVMEGGKHGAPIVSGKPDSSLLIQKLNLKPPFGDPMPLKTKSPISQDTLKIIRAWISQGAKNN